MSASSQLARQLQDVVASVSGVATLYPAQAAPVVALATIAARVAGAEVLNPVVIGDDGEGLTVSVTIGVTEDISAAETCRAVYEAIVECLARAGAAPASAVRVTVAAIT